MGEARRKPSRRQPVHPSIAFSRELVFYDDGPVQRKFQQRFSESIDQFVDAGFRAHAEVELAGKNWPKSERVQHVMLFLHVALNSLYTSAHFLVSGYHQAAGYQARSYGEACAMAMLLLSDEEWSVFNKQKTDYPAHKAMSRVTRKTTSKILAKKLGFSLEGWSAYNSIHALYDQFAHAGAFTLALHLNLANGTTLLAGEFDLAKQPEYRGHIEALTRGANSLAELTKRIGKHATTIL